MSKDRTNYPEKCEKCEHRKTIHSVSSYYFCKKMNLSFGGNEPKSFFDCEKYDAAQTK